MAKWWASKYWAQGWAAKFELVQGLALELFDSKTSNSIA